MIRVCAFVLLVVSVACAGANAPPIEVKVGVTEYQHIDQIYERYLTLFRDVETASNSRFRFSVAVGTYDEVLKWRDHGDIDLAVLSAAPVAHLLSVGTTDDRQELLNNYLGHLVYFKPGEPGRSTALDLSSAKVQTDGYYRSVCVVRTQSPFHNLDDIARAASQPKSRVKFLFVRPYSISGYIHPRYVLETAGTNLKVGSPFKGVNPEFTNQHDASLNRLLSPRSDERGEDLVAFVQDQTFFDSKNLPELRSIPIPELDDLKIPQEGMFVGARFLAENRPGVRAQLLAALNTLRAGPDRNCDLQTSRMCFDSVTPAQQWIASYQGVIEETRTIPLPPTSEFRAVLDDLVNELALYRRRLKKEPRLALVLSGGGAKCAYQVGALNAIAEHVKSLSPEKRPEVNLVVGTSGGSINALFYSLGLDADLEGTWRGFDQEKLIRPSVGTRVLWGLFFGIMCVLLVLLFSLLFGRLWWCAAVLLLLSALLIVGIGSELTVGALHNHWLYHDLLLLKLSVWTACLTLAVAIALVAIPVTRNAFSNHLVLANVVGGLFLLAMVALFTGVLFHDEYLTDLSGVKEAFVGKLPGFIPDVHTQVEASRTLDENLQAISKAIVESSGDAGIRRDLILTASMLPADTLKGSSLPPDLYFYYDVGLDHREPSTLPNRGDKRFISLRENSDKLLHVVLGSSTIYPFFHSQRLDHLKVARPEPNVQRADNAGARALRFAPPEEIRSIDIVDGGFSHNSPVEAAIAWGATHILLIEASPKPRYDRPRTLAGHMLYAFNYLFDQAQRSDSSVRGNVEIFELAPSYGCDEWFDPQCVDQRHTWLDLLDFAAPLLKGAIDHGRDDVDGKPLRPLFIRIPGPPIFIPVSLKPDSSQPDAAARSSSQEKPRS